MQTGTYQPPALTTGLAGLDRVMRGVSAGDNVVWQVEQIDDYAALVLPYAQAARKAGAHLVYFHFADAPPLLPPDLGAEYIRLHPAIGFEPFVEQVHSVIERAGRGAMYVFDCLSVLAEAWQADQLIGNFFMLTCPRLYDLETVTYFAVYRNRHTDYAMQAIADTTQWLLDIFRHDGRIYVRPIKVQHRSSDSMKLMHEWDGDEMRPVTESATVAELLAGVDWPGLQVDNRIGYWKRYYLEGRDLVRRRGTPTEDRAGEQTLFRRLAGMMLADDPRLLAIAERYLRLDDLLIIRDRQIGIGRIGGKAVGMLLARAILAREQPDIAARLEAHDSFYVGAEVFQTFLVRNRLWWERRRQRDPRTFLQGIAEVRERIRTAELPPHAVEQLSDMLDYFGEWPFIVRSSSLLEDAYGNAFAGKYESVFCVNRGTREERLQSLLDAIRTVYASTMSEEALMYRHRRGLLDRDEQMALLIMRVSGASRGRYFFPMAAGVGLSFNPYPWNPAIDPAAGVVRLVFGLGTRAVDRSDDDYTRLVALNQPDLRPESSFDMVMDVSQHNVDVLDSETNRLTSAHLLTVLPHATGIPLELFLSTERDSEGRELNAITFEGLLRDTDVVRVLRQMLSTLECIYAHPVEIEFTFNMLRSGGYRINLLQCRTLQVRRDGVGLPPGTWPVEAAACLAATGAVIGMSRDVKIDVVVLVDPDAFAALPMQDRHEVARCVGRVNRACGGRDQSMLLLGPGRWGTRDPALGVPVHYSEINHVSALGEIVSMHGTLMPDASLGTHFLSELVEMDILYFALFPGRAGNRFESRAFPATRNRLPEWSPGDTRMESLVRVYAAEDFGAGELHLVADAPTQRVLLFQPA